MAGPVISMGASPLVPPVLPPLREDIRLQAAPPGADGQPHWTLHDPANHRFLRIGWPEFELLSRWGLRRSDAVLQAVARDTTLRPTEQDLHDLLRFLDIAGLLLPLGDAGLQKLMAEKSRRTLSAAAWLLKNYLFLRIRLLNPDPLLAALQPWVAWAYHRRFPAGLLGMALLALFLVGRQWDSFTHSLPQLFTPAGLVAAGIALSLSKIVHEFGHGLTAKRFGCRVNSMGLAFLVLWPVLWTDTTDAWRLTDRRQRLAIDAAGMGAELILAVTAALIWAVLPDGPARGAAFTLASSTWILTLAVNLNPLMRFDGYFLLSDLLDVPNLQDRAFALGRWWLREQLFGLGEPVPEHHAPLRHKLLIAYALATWIYRFSLFMGIALLVYHMAFKALGLFLMWVEIWWFILRPIIAELRQWLDRRGKLGKNRRGLITFSALLLALLGLALPWQGEVRAPALLRAARQLPLLAPRSGMLINFPKEGQRVQDGDALFVLDAAEVDFRIQTSQAQLAGAQARMAGMAFDQEAAADSEVGWQELNRLAADLQADDAERDSLTLHAPFSGVVLDLAPMLRPDLPVAKHEFLGTLIDPSSALVEAYVDEADLERLKTGMTARFYPENGESPHKLRLAIINHAPTRDLAVRELASTQGGAIPVRQDGNRLIPEQSLYRVAFEEEASPAPTAQRRGTVVIDADAQAPLLALYHRTAALMVRESGL